MSYDIKYFTADANEAVSIIFVSFPEDMEHSKNVYKPKMTHQIFDKESIFGYCELQINLYYSCYTYHCFVEIRHAEIWPSGIFGMKADDIIGSLNPWLREAMLLNKSDFLKALQSPAGRICFGETLHEFQHEIENSREDILNLSIHSCDINDNEFAKLHQRFESLIIMYIDAANFIDFSDNNWRVVYLYQKKNIQPDSVYYCPIGFCTIYIFTFTKVGRISQFFIIPKYQRKGLGFVLLSTVYEYLRSDRFQLKKITVESPNEMFTDLRNKVDVTHSINLPSFQKEELQKGFSDAMAAEAAIYLKMGRRQSKKVYEILRAHYCQPDTKEYDNFKADFIKDRKLKILGLDDLPSDEREELLKIFEEDIVLEANNMNDSFDKFMKSIENVLQHLRKKRPGVSA